MTSNLAHVEFYFPHDIKGIKNRQELAGLLVEKIKENDSLGYSGHADEKALRESIENHLGDIDIENYEVLSNEQMKEIKEVVERVVDRCNEALPIPTKNYIFIFPWFPNEDYQMFGGVMGVAPYSCVLHLYLSPRLWSPKTLSDSLSHELNHTIFYYYHYDRFNNYTLLDELVMEGLAENFREYVVNPISSPWSLALNQEEAFSLAGSIKDKLDSKDRNLIQGLLFGSDKYKRWTGYSVGYWLVKKFIEQNSDLSWTEIMKKQPQEIFDSVMINEKAR